MKGSVFQGLNEFIETEFGLAIWQDILDNNDIPSEGEYLASDNYSDDELITIIVALSKLTGLTPEEIQRQFGAVFFNTLFSMIKERVEDIDNLFDFLRAVDTVIHVEVQKSDPLAYLPSLFYDQPKQQELIIRYLSVRKMCFFAEGLILGAAKYYKQDINISQNQCMHDGADCCLIKITT